MSYIELEGDRCLQKVTIIGLGGSCNWLRPSDPSIHRQVQSSQIAGCKILKLAFFISEFLGASCCSWHLHTSLSPSLSFPLMNTHTPTHISSISKRAPPPINHVFSWVYKPLVAPNALRLQFHIVHVHTFSHDLHAPHPLLNAHCPYICRTPYSESVLHI